MARANELGPPVPGGVVGGVPSGVPSGVRGGVPGGVIGGIIGSVPSNAPAPPRPESVAPTVPAPPVVQKVDPVYPLLARQARISGVVRLKVAIQADGQVNRIEVISGHPLLVPPSIEAVRKWVFQSSAAPVTTIIEVPFAIGDTAGLPPLPADTPRKTGEMRIRIGGNVQAARLISRVDPVYPAQARTERIEGNVQLQIDIAQDGSVERVGAVVEGNPVLVPAAMEAVMQWKYQPTLLNGDPVKVSTTVTVPFELK